MERPQLNYLAILSSAVIWWIIGALWYSPALFGNPWMAIVGVTPDMAASMGLVKMALVPLLGYFIACYVLAHAAAYAKATTAWSGVLVGFWNWLGLVAALMFVNNSFQFKPFELWLIDAGYHLIGLVIAGILIAVWKPRAKSA
jgi:hypothetical protein